MINIAIVSTVSIVMIVAGFIAVFNKSLKVAILASGFISLIASILFLVLSAPDVAMTEAAIGSALVTAIFFYVLNKIKTGDDK